MGGCAGQEKRPAEEIPQKERTDASPPEQGNKMPPSTISDGLQAFPIVMNRVANLLEQLLALLFSRISKTTAIIVLRAKLLNRIAYPPNVVPSPVGEIDLVQHQPRQPKCKKTTR